MASAEVHRDLNKYPPEWQAAANYLVHDLHPMALRDAGREEEATILGLFLGTLAENPKREQKFHSWVERIRAERAKYAALQSHSQKEVEPDADSPTSSSEEEGKLKQLRLFPE